MRRTLAWPLLVFAVLGSQPRCLRAQAAGTPPPPEITDSMIARGKQVFRGPANCVACHGERGQGTTLGPDLTDPVWIHGAGSYADIVDRVVHGVPKRQSSTGQPMPMRGWSPASDDEVRAVAAYVWSLSHAPKDGKQ